MSWTPMPGDRAVLVSTGRWVGSEVVVASAVSALPIPRPSVEVELPDGSSSIVRLDELAPSVEPETFVVGDELEWSGDGAICRPGSGVVVRVQDGRAIVDPAVPLFPAGILPSTLEAGRRIGLCAGRLVPAVGRRARLRALGETALEAGAKIGDGCRIIAEAGARRFFVVVDGIDHRAVTVEARDLADVLPADGVQQLPKREPKPCRIVALDDNRIGRLGVLVGDSALLIAFAGDGLAEIEIRGERLVVDSSQIVEDPLERHLDERDRMARLGVLSSDAAEAGAELEDAIFMLAPVQCSREWIVADRTRLLSRAFRVHADHLAAR